MGKKNKDLKKLLITQLLDQCLQVLNLSDLNSKELLKQYQQLNSTVEKIVHLEKGEKKMTSDLI